jgi:hypothetical protein
MTRFNNIEDLDEHIANLDWINFQIADLKLAKEKLENFILELIGSVEYVDDEIVNISHAGSKTHNSGRYKITVTTDYNYKINKEAYEQLKEKISPEFDPVIKEEKYRVSKNIYFALDKFGSIEEKKARDKFITLEFAKPRIEVKKNV